MLDHIIASADPDGSPPPPLNAQRTQTSKLTLEGIIAAIPPYRDDAAKSSARCGHGFNTLLTTRINGLLHSSSFERGGLQQGISLHLWGALTMSPFLEISVYEANGMLEWALRQKG